MSEDRTAVITSEWDAQRRQAPRYHEHRYRGGPPPPRLRQMQINHESRARREGRPWDMVDLRTVYAHHGGICGICREPVAFDVFTIDHVIPTSRGGPHVFANIQPAHLSCNSRKGGR